MADVITTLHPEGAPEDDLYPNIKKENLPSTLQPVADFALSEYEKTLNLINGIFTNGQAYSGTGNTYSDSSAKCILLELEPNTEYALNNGGYSWVNEYDSTKTFLRQKPAPGTFTTSSDCVFVGLTYPIDANAMLNFGETVSPYQPYNGDVMHAIDVEGVKLWENASPTSAFVGQTVTISDSTGYKRLKFVFKRTNDNYVVPIIIETNNGFGDIYLSTALRGTVFAREVHILSHTSIQFAGGTEGTAVNNSACVPVTVYGIK